MKEIPYALKQMQVMSNKGNRIGIWALTDSKEKVDALRLKAIRVDICDDLQDLSERLASITKRDDSILQAHMLLQDAQIVLATKERS